MSTARKPDSSGTDIQRGEAGDLRQSEAQRQVRTNRRGELIAEQPIRGQIHRGEAREPIGSVDARAWNSPGESVAQQDDQGRTVKFEGWLSSPNGSRGSKEAELQRRSKEGLTNPGNYDGTHLIADSAGGPRVDTHGEALTQANLIAADSRINRSHLSAHEAQLRDDLRSGREIYVQAQVHHEPGQKNPTGVTYRYFEKGPDGQPQARPVSEVYTRVDRKPPCTLDQSCRHATGGREGAKEFASPTHKGTTPSVH